MSRQLSNRRAKQNQDRAHYPALNSLVTDQEHQVDEAKTMKNPLAQLRIIEKPLLTYIDEEDEPDVSVEELKQSDAEKMSVLVGQLLAKNKINAKNAFEVPLIHLHQTYAFAESSSDNSWKRLSSSLESNNKIYAYRVDATHSETYRILEVISRQEKKINEEGRISLGSRLEKSEELHSDSSEHDSSKKHSDFLEKNYKNINIVQLDTFFNVNPVLEKTKRIFDQNGTKTLLLNCLEISPNLSLTITLVHQQNLEAIVEQQWQSIDPDTIWMEPFEGDNIFRQIQCICVANDLLGEEDQALKHQTGEIEAMWRELDGFQRRRQRGNLASEGGRLRKLIENENGNNEENQIPEIIITSPNTELRDSMSAEAFPQSFLLQNESHNDVMISQQLLDLPVQLLPLPITSEFSQDFSLREVNILVDQSQTNSNNTHLSDSQRNAKHLYSHDIALREIITEGVKEQDLSLDVKKADKPPSKRVPRKKKQFVPLNIDFLEKESIALSRRAQNLSIDKKKRKEFKSLLKSLKIDAYVEKNIVIDLKSKLDFRMKTLLSDFCQKKTDQSNEIAGDNSRIIDLDFLSASKTKMMRNGRNISIHDTKQSLKQLIEASPSNQLSFIDIYEQMIECQGYISPALCFLTVLHLANENGYSLMQHEGEYNYVITTH